MNTSNPKDNSDYSLVRDHWFLASNPEVRELIEQIPGLCIVFNGFLETICASKDTLILSGVSSADDVLARPPGALLGCTHQYMSNRECGTTPQCANCSVRTLLQEAISRKREVEGIVQLFHKSGTGSINYKMICRPIVVNNANLLLCRLENMQYMQDFKILRRFLFTDLKDSVLALEELIKLEQGDTHHKKEYRAQIVQLIEEIRLQLERQHLLYSAQLGSLVPRTIPVSLESVQDLIESSLERNPLCQGVELYYQFDRDLFIHTDPVVLRICMLELVLNGLEASEDGTELIIKGHRIENRFHFSVSNKGSISPSIVANMFQLHFSTKGEGRGLGLYMVKLLTERYLGGIISHDQEGDTTVFTLDLPSLSNTLVDEF